MKIITYENEQLWAEARNDGRLGCSDTPLLFGKGYSGQTLLGLYHQKIGNPQPFTKSRRMEAGTLNEPLMRRVFTEETGLELQYTPWQRVLHPEAPLAWSPDGIVIDDGKPVPLEMKFVVDNDTVKQWIDGVPERLFIQLQAEIACCDATHGYAFCVAKGDFDTPFIHRVDRHPEWIDAILREVRNFSVSVDLRIPPDPTSGDNEVIRRLYPAHEAGKTQELPVDLLDRLLECKARRDAVNDEYDGLQNAVKVLLGDAEIGTVEGGKYSVTYKTTNRKGYVVEPTTIRTLRIKEL